MGTDKHKYWHWLHCSPPEGRCLLSELKLSHPDGLENGVPNTTSETERGGAVRVRGTLSWVTWRRGVADGPHPLRTVNVGTLVLPSRRALSHPHLSLRIDVG